MGFQIIEIKINQEIEPLGLDERCPQISWKFKAEGAMRQERYRVTVGTEPGGLDCWDTGVVQSSRSIGIPYKGKELEPETAYYVTLEVWDQRGESETGSTFFETGLLNPSLEAWNGAQWIGAPEYYVASDTISVFTISSKLQIQPGGRRAGIVFGAKDERLMNRERNEMLLEGENYISFVLNVEPDPAVVEIYRVGYDKNDKKDVPFYVIPAVSKDSGLALVTGENANQEHLLEVEVTGNCAYTYLDGQLIDKETRMKFFGEEEGPRQLNPLGDNDITTYPRLCEIGYYVEAGTSAHFDGLRVRHNRTPKAVFVELDTEQGKTIEAREDVLETTDPSVHSLPMLRRDFTVKGNVKTARLYATARGIYEAMINGKPVSDSYFAPGASQYDHHLMYQTYDVTELLKEGENGIGFTISSGWWSDMSTYVLGNYNFWGDQPSLLARLVVTYENGCRDIFVTDCESWQYYGEGPYRFAGFFNGEHQDGRRAWIAQEYSKPGFSIEGMKQPHEIHPVPIEGIKMPIPIMPDWPDVNMTEPQLTGSINAPVRQCEVFTAKWMESPGKGVYLYDLGQEIAGIPRIQFHGAPGTRIRIRYGEMKYPHLPEYGELAGRLLQVNLREASNTDIFILGEEQDIFQPHFTFHGFRYIEISGIENPPELKEVQGILLSSIPAVTGAFSCDNDLVNQLASNVKYSMLCNYMSIPTDCPQRNERMGWVGDTHVFARTATYEADVKNFLRRNMQAIRDLQTPEGRLPNIAPFGGGFGGITYESALFVLTWELYQQYGDQEIIRENYPAMKKWMEAMEDLGLPGTAYVGPINDWLAPDNTDDHLVWNAFFGRDALYMKKFARILDYHQDAAHYLELEERIRGYWQEHFVDKETGKTTNYDGSICDSQGSYVIGLSCEMFEPAWRSKAAEHLARRTREVGYTVRTGFFGTGPLNPMLTAYGHYEEAYRLITQTEYPSWLYPVTQGATTIWERWDSYTKERGFGDNNAMNSFNHYSLGSVLSWCYEAVLGICRDEEYPGYEHFFLKPVIYGFRKAQGGIEVPEGRIESRWQMVGDELMYTCTIPANTTATLELNGVERELGSGTHSFICQ